METENNAPVIRKKSAQTLQRGKIFVKATFNNTMVTLTDMEGRVVLWNSAGLSGFKGSRKATPFAATTTIEKILEKSRGLGLRQLEVFIKGPGPGRDAILRVLRNYEIKINLLADVTPIPHNGPRPKKRRRI